MRKSEQRANKGDRINAKCRDKDAKRRAPELAVESVKGRIHQSCLFSIVQRVCRGGPDFVAARIRTGSPARLGSGACGKQSQDHPVHQTTLPLKLKKRVAAKNRDRADEDNRVPKKVAGAIVRNPNTVLQLAEC